MFKFPTIAIVTALASIGAVAASSITSEAASDPRFVASVVVQHYRNLADTTPAAMTSSPGSVRGAEEECTDVVAIDTFMPSEAGNKELEDWGEDLAAALQADPTTLSLDFSKNKLPTFVKEYQEACTEAGGDNYLFSIKTEGCDLLSDGLAKEYGLEALLGTIKFEIKSAPVCLGNCPNGEKYADALAALDPTCKDAFSITSGGSAMSGVFLGIGAVVATFTMLIM